MLVELTAGGSTVRQLTYALRRGEQMWNFNHASPVEDFSALHPVFDLSFQTVHFLDEGGG